MLSNQAELKDPTCRASVGGIGCNPELVSAPLFHGMLEVDTLPQSPQPHRTPRSPRVQRSPQGPHPDAAAFPPAPEPMVLPLTRGKPIPALISPYIRDTPFWGCCTLAPAKPDWGQSAFQTGVTGFMMSRLSDRFVFVLEGNEGSEGTVSLLPWHYIHPENGVSLGMATSAKHPSDSAPRQVRAREHEQHVLGTLDRL